MDRSKRNVTLCLIGFLAGCYFPACSSSPTHPPNFKDFQRAKRLSESDWESGNVPYAAAKFTEEEISRIEMRSIPCEMIGAAIQAPIAEERSIGLLEAAAKKDPSDSVCLAALAYRHLTLLENKSSLTTTSATAIAINKFLSADVENAVPLYLKAELATVIGDYVQARLRLNEATQKSKFETYNVPIRKCLVIAAESLNFPKFTARQIALGQTPALSSWLALKKAILNDAASDLRAIENCLALGRRCENQSTLFIEELVGFSIQIKALEKLNDPSLNVEKERIQHRKDFIYRAISFLNSDQTKKVKEQRCIEYFDEVYNVNEAQASKRLAVELGNKTLAD